MDDDYSDESGGENESLTSEESESSTDDESDSDLYDYDHIDGDEEYDDDDDEFQSQEQSESVSSQTTNPWSRVYPIENIALDNDFDQKIGLKDVPLPDSRPVQYFNLFMTPEFINSAVKHTNDYALHFLTTNNSKLKEHPIFKRWVDTTEIEMKGFIAILLNMAISGRPDLECYWSIHPILCAPWYEKMMSQDRFLQLFKFFHLIPPNSSHDTGYAKFQPMIDRLNDASCKHYVPSQNLYIDESVVGVKNKYKRRLTDYQMRYRIWMLCESESGYVLSYFVRCGKEEHQQADDGRGSTHRTLLTLFEKRNLLGKGYHVFCNNYFTSVELAKEFHDHKTYVTGHLRKSSTGLPMSIKDKSQTDLCCFFRQDYLLALAYRTKQNQRKPELYLSTLALANVTEVIKKSKRRGNQAQQPNVRPKSKPNMVLDYKRNLMKMLLIHEVDMIWCAMDEGKPMKQWRKVMSNILGRMVMNAYLLYKKNIAPKKPVSQSKFTGRIIEDLAEEHLKAKGPQKENLLVITIPGKKGKDCCECSDRTLPGGRKRSSTQCVRCEKGLHETCSTDHKC